MNVQLPREIKRLKNPHIFIKSKGHESLDPPTCWAPVDILHSLAKDSHCLDPLFAITAITLGQALPLVLGCSNSLNS